jgi:hypothetical protein
VSGKEYWVITRPKRKLILVPDLLKLFSAVALGEKWNQNREVQQKFEKALSDAQWKAQNVSADGSGGRTYAVLLYMLGLWYEDIYKGVQITLAGQEILDGESPVPIITKQLLDLQFPSPYSTKPNVNVSRDFQVQPFRFVLRLFLEKNFQEITQDEIAYCLVPFAKKDSDLNDCAERIKEYRKEPEAITILAVKKSGTTSDNLKNIGNTVVNQLEYTGYFSETEDIKSLIFDTRKFVDAKDLLNTLRTSLLQNPENEPLFQRRFGTGLNKTKDYSHSVRQPMSVKPNERKILEQFYIIASNEPIYSATPDLRKRISDFTGASDSLVKKVLERLPLDKQASQFYESYVKLSIGGIPTAEDFERKTTALYNDGFKISAKWVGNKPRHPDIIIFIDRTNKIHGILDTKAYRDYNLPLDHKNKMAYTYIPDFHTFCFEGEEYNLAFFGYISGGFSDNIKKSFSELLGMTQIPGHYITARNLLNLLEFYNKKSLTTTDLLHVFSSNKEVLPYEIEW